MRGDKEKGFFSVEIIPYLVALSGLVFFLLYFFPFWERFFTGRVLLENASRGLEKAVRYNFERVRSFLEKAGCYGWDDSPCTVLSLTPSVPEAERLSFTVYGPVDRPDPYFVELVKKSGCLILGSELLQTTTIDGNGVGIYRVDVGCRVAGTRAVFEVVGEHQPSSPYTDIYFFSPYVKIEFYGTKGELRHRDFVVFEREREIGIREGERRTVAVLTALRRFSLRELFYENANSCVEGLGGLYPFEDFLIPWAWRVNSEQAITCLGADNTLTGCGCSNNNPQTAWARDGNLSVVGTKEEWVRLLRVLGLPEKYMTDYFGNPFHLILFVQAGRAKAWNSTGDFYPLRPYPFSCGERDGFCPSVSASSVRAYYLSDLSFPLNALMGVRRGSELISEMLISYDP